MYKFLNDNNILYKQQFSFRQNFFTTHIFINLTEKSRQVLDEGNVAAEYL